MPTIIPFAPGDPEQIIPITLDDVPYVLRARWNTRDNGGAGSWYLDTWERDGTTQIAMGLKLVLGVRLGETYNHPLFLGGVFVVPDPGVTREAGLFDLGATHILVHQTVADAVLAAALPPDVTADQLPALVGP